MATTASIMENGTAKLPGLVFIKIQNKLPKMENRFLDQAARVLFFWII